MQSPSQPQAQTLSLTPSRTQTQSPSRTSPNGIAATDPPVAPGVQARVRRVAVAIIGAGPAALTLAARLAEPAADCSGGYVLGMGSDVRDTFARYTASSEPGAGSVPPPSSWLAVVDPGTGWLAGWHAAMALLRVRHLRSHVDVHPDPRGSRALLQFLAGLPPLPPAIKLSAKSHSQAISTHGGGGYARASRHSLDGRPDSAALPSSLFDLPSGMEGHIHVGESALASGDFAEAAEARSAAGSGHLLPMEFVGRGREFAGPFLLPSIDGFRMYTDALVARYSLQDVLVRSRAVAVKRLMLTGVSNTAPEAAAAVDGPAVGEAGGAQRYRVRLADGSEIHATAVVMAVGSAGAPRWPEWAIDARANFPEAPQASLAHASETECIAAAAAGLARSSDNKPCGSSASTPPQGLRGRRVCVVGGGLSAVQLALSAVAYGAAHVVLLSRRRIVVRQFDLPLNWMAWSHRPAQLRSFWAQRTPAARVAAAAAARGGGSITPEAARDLWAAVRAGQIELLVGAAADVAAACWLPAPTSAARSADAPYHVTEGDMIAGNIAPTGAWELWAADGSIVAGEAHHVWLATGYAPGISNATTESQAGPMGDAYSAAGPAALLSQLQATFGGPMAPTSSSELGFPVLTPSLRLSPSEDIFVVGALAAVQLGPDAGNLAGARAASVRVAACLRSLLPSLVDAPCGSPACYTRHERAETALNIALKANDAALLQAQTPPRQVDASPGDAAATQSDKAALTRLPFRVKLTRAREPFLQYYADETPLGV